MAYKSKWTWHLKNFCRRTVSFYDYHVLYCSGVKQLILARGSYANKKWIGDHTKKNKLNKLIWYIEETRPSRPTMRPWAYKAQEAHVWSTCMKHMKHIKHTQHTMHIQQCQCWTAPMIFIEKTAHFRRLKKTGYTGTDGRTDRPTDGPTDTTSYRDARTHLKTNNFRK